jgi:aminopeptidase
MLEIPGATCLGELAFGVNDNIGYFTKNTLFDEKIGGTFHIALGDTYPNTGGTNKSAIHWDMIFDLRNEGKVYGDGKLIQTNGCWLI